CTPSSDSCIWSEGNGCWVANDGAEFPPTAPTKSPMMLMSGSSAFAAAVTPPYTGSEPVVASAGGCPGACAGMGTEATGCGAFGAPAAACCSPGVGVGAG